MIKFKDILQEASVYKYMSNKAPKDKIEMYKFTNVTYHSIIASKLSLIKALKNLGYDISKKQLNRDKISVTNVISGQEQDFIYGVDFTSSFVNTIHI